MKYYIGADLGTSALKLLLVDCNGKIVHSVTKNYEVFYPHPGWSEQNPEDWWTAFSEGVQELLLHYNKEDIVALAVAGQMHGLVVLDENDRLKAVEFRLIYSLQTYNIISNLVEKLAALDFIVFVFRIFAESIEHVGKVYVIVIVVEVAYVKEL